MRNLILAMTAIVLTALTAKADLTNMRSEELARRQQVQARKALVTYKRAVLPATNAGGKMVITAGFVSHDGGLLMKQVRVNGMRLSTYGTMGLCYRLGYLVGEATKTVLNATEEKLAIPMLSGELEHETFAAVDDAEVAAGAVHCHDSNQPSRLAGPSHQAAL